MTGRKSDFTLTSLDDLFKSKEVRDEEKLSKIRDIPLSQIDGFPDHPFKVKDDEDMMQLIESIKERGIITPATVRLKDDGRYELISGHRRKRACELAGFETLRCEVVELTKDEATILMVESNYQRSQILPSEKAFAYKMRLDAMKRQAGRPSKDNSSPVGIDLEEGAINITKTYHHMNGEDVITSPKTPSSFRKVSMPAFLVDEIKEYLGSLYNLEPDERVFKFRRHQLNKNLDYIIDQYKLKKITIHGLRHSHVSLLISRKYDIFEVSKRIGHKSIVTTQNIYGHLFDGVQKTIASDLDKMRKGV